MKLDVYRKYQSLEEATELTDLLQANGIAFKLDDYSTQSEIIGFVQTIDLKIVVLARIEDFPKIDSLIDKSIEISLETIDKEHYLFAFSNDELTEIIIKPSEWSNYDYKVAELLLQERGIPLNAKFIENIKQQQYTNLAIKETYSTMWIIVGYISAFLGGFLGFAIGLSLCFMKKKLPNGEKTYVYTENDRNHGKWITGIGITMSIAYLAWRMYYRFI